MDAIPADVRRLRSLLDENETLREEIRQLREMLCPPLDLPASWRLSRSEAIILRALRAGGPNWVSKDRIYAALYGDREGPSLDSFGAMLTYLRRKLRGHSPDVVIENLPFIGWRLSPAGTAALEAACAAERAAYAAATEEVTR